MEGEINGVIPFRYYISRLSNKKTKEKYDCSGCRTVDIVSMVKEQVAKHSRHVHGIIIEYFERHLLCTGGIAQW